MEGRPELAHIRTSYAERANLTLRTESPRFTRLTNAFFEKAENHAHSVAPPNAVGFRKHSLDAALHPGDGGGLQRQLM